jgi:CHAD domain-containing protein
MAKARTIPGLGKATSFREAAARAVEVRTEELFSFADGVLDTGDVERVHDMRVATRRLRAVLEVCAPCFPKKRHKEALREVKALADALGLRRDPDVQIAAIEREAAELAPGQRRGVPKLVGALRARQEEGNAELARALQESADSGLRDRLWALAAEARSR